MVCFDKTFEAAEALLHMESPGGLQNERSTGKYTVCASPLCHFFIAEWSANGINPWEYQLDVFTSLKRFGPTQELPENVQSRVLLFSFIIFYM